MALLSKLARLQPVMLSMPSPPCAWLHYRDLRPCTKVRQSLRFTAGPMASLLSFDLVLQAPCSGGRAGPLQIRQESHILTADIQNRSGLCMTKKPTNLVSSLTD